MGNIVFRDRYEVSSELGKKTLKPSNIILTNRSGHSVGKAYLVDFGSVQNEALQEGL